MTTHTESIPAAILTWTSLVDGREQTLIFRVDPVNPKTERLVAIDPPVRLTADPWQLARETAMAKIAAGCTTVHLRPVTPAGTTADRPFPVRMDAVPIRMHAWGLPNHSEPFDQERD